MPKVLVVATSRKTRGGITSVVKAHETGEQWKRFHCHWVQTHRDGPAWRKILYFATGMLDFLLRIPFYDIVHIHVSQPVTIKRKRPFLTIAKKLHKKTIVHFHAFNIEDTVAGNYSDKYLQFFKTADKIVVLSNWWKKQLLHHLNLNENKIEVLYNPCPEVGVIPKKNPQKYILYAGTVNERKGYADLIKAFSYIACEFLDWKVVIAGNGEIEQGENLAKELGIQSQVEFTGWISGEKKKQIFANASIFCLPSYAEGFPMAVLDAWAYGLPVVTTPVGGIPDVAKDGKNMLLFSPGDTAALATKLRAIISNGELRYKIACASLNFANSQFNVSTINSKLDKIYRDL